jgi:hypothetical protein
MIRWQRFQRERATEAEVREWWRKWPGANVGVALGAASGMIGLDIDGDEGWQVLLEWSGGEAGLPPTPSFTTPNQGRRLLFALPPDVGLRIRRFDRPGTSKEAVRILAAGSQTVMPPSRLERGAYAWLPGRSPEDLPLAAPPPWLIERGCGPTPPPLRDAVVRARQYLARCPEAVSGDNGHTQTLRVADKLAVGFDLTDSEAEMLLLEEFNPRCRPPWTIEELRRKIAEARRTTRRLPGYLLHGQASAAPAAPPRTVSAEALLADSFPEARWAVPGLLPEGLALLAGRPKGGKSWLILQVALAITDGLPALGSFRAERGEALYCALEDGPRRLQARLRRMIGTVTGGPPGLFLATAWPRLGQGCLEAIEDWLDDHPDARLVAIDTLARIRDRRVRSASLYDADYDTIAALADLANRRRVSVCVVHHTRKPREAAEDPFDTISGTQGLSGAADLMMVLKKPQAGGLGRLSITGRDVQERELSLSWCPDSCLWTVEETEATTPNERAALEALREAGRPLAPAEMALRLGKTREAAKKMLQRMAEAGKLQPAGGGRYDLASPPSPASATLFSETS